MFNLFNNSWTERKEQQLDLCLVCNFKYIFEGFILRPAEQFDYKASTLPEETSVNMHVCRLKINFSGQSKSNSSNEHLYTTKTYL